jgi:hypothetical protein
VSGRIVARAVWANVAVCVVLAAAALALIVAAAGTPVPDVWGVRGVPLGIAVSYALVGAVVASSRPWNPIGWLLSAAGFCGAVQTTTQEYARYAIFVDPTLAGGTFAAWLANWFWVPLMSIVGIFMPLLFPDGRPLSRRWVAVAWLGAAGSAAAIVGQALTPGEMLSETYAQNPFGVVGGENLVYAFYLGVTAVLAAIGGAGWSLMMRLRRSRGVERQQVKWLAYTASALPIPLVAQAVFEVKAAEVISVVVLALVSIAAGIAILRYRLYDIDLLINRTLVYGALSALLAATYFGAVVLLGALLRPFAAESELAVAGSTLAVVVLFAPLRSRIQRLVDERFYRSKYDAARTLDAFSARLRDQVDLDALEREVLGVVGQTVQPAHAALWLRERAR